MEMKIILTMLVFKQILTLSLFDCPVQGGIKTSSAIMIAVLKHKLYLLIVLCSSASEHTAGAYSLFESIC